MRNDDNRENRSPNSRSAPPSGLESENPTGFRPPFQNAATHGMDHTLGLMPSPTSAPKPSLWQNWEDSQQHQAAQQRAQHPPQAPTLLSEATSPASSIHATGNIGATRVGARGTPHPPTSQTSQQSNLTQAQDGRFINVGRVPGKGYF